MRIEIPVHLRWSDMDAYGHVNNVDLMRVLEIARIEAFWSSPSNTHATGIIAAGPEADTHTFVARHEIEYQVALKYRAEPVIVELWIGHIGGASIDISYRVLDSGRDAALQPERETTPNSESTPNSKSTPNSEPERDETSPHREDAVSGSAVVYAIATTTLVMVDRESGRPRRITALEKAAWEDFVEPPVMFKHRR